MRKPKNANMHYDEPLNMRTRQWDEHYCRVSKNGEYVGSLYLTAKMRKIWRANKLTVTIIDI